MATPKQKAVYMIRQKSTGKYFSSPYSFTHQGRIFRRMFDVKDCLKQLYQTLSHRSDKSGALSDMLNDIELIEFTETSAKSLHFMINEIDE